MKPLPFDPCLTLSCALLLSAIPNDYFNIDSRIVGGQNAQPGQFPYLASLRRANGNHFCGSSIIRPSWVLSAAHCTEDFADDGITVVVGTHLLSAGGVRFQSSRIINHEEYNRARLTNDISVVQVAGTFTYTDLVQPIGIGFGTIGEADAQVSGWGLLTVSVITLTKVETMKLM